MQNKSIIKFVVTCLIFVSMATPAFATDDNYVLSQMANVLTELKNIVESLTQELQQISASSNLAQIISVIDVDSAASVSGLVAHWKFDEGSGTTAKNAATSGYNGTLVNGPQWVSGKKGGALNFDGVDDAVKIAASSPAALDNLGQLTYSAWIKPRTMGEGGLSRIITKDDGWGTGWIYFALIGNKTLSFSKDYRSTNLVVTSNSNTVTLGEWQHIAVTWDGSAVAANVKIYRNGTEVSYQTQQSGVGYRENDTAQSHYIGNHGGGASTFDGLIDDVRIYNRALSSSEVAALAADGIVIDVTPPVITSVTASPGPNSASISWATNELATRQVEYGLTTAYDSQTTEDKTLATSHTVALSALTPATTYHYRVKSKDAAGNLATSPDYSFTTSAKIVGSGPNIVVITTDDMNYTTDSIQVMAKVKSLLANRGVTFSNSFVDNPLCCPNRASFLTGQNSRNSGVFTNDPPTGGYENLIPTENNTLPVWMQNAGYHTALIGKYLNGYGGRTSKTKIPPGWNTWFGLVGNPHTYYDYTVNDNGTLRTYGSAPADYQTDVLAQRAVDFLNQRAKSAEPFFLWLTPFAPHDGAPAINTPEPAPRHKGVYSSVPLPRPPSFNEVDLSDKPAFMAKDFPLLSESSIAYITKNFRRVRETLLGVDDMVEKVVNTLQNTGKLDNTIIIFTSDNGYFYGEHRVPRGKLIVYEEAIRVPLVVKGPSIPQGQTRTQLVNNLDLSATIMELAKATPGRALDGRSLVPLLNNAAIPWRAALLVQGSDRAGGDSRYKAIRTSRYKYVEHRKFDGTLFAKELYDLTLDPYELVSKHNDASYTAIMNGLASTLAMAKKCSGSDCWITSDEIPNSEPSPVSSPSTALDLSPSEDDKFSPHQEFALLTKNLSIGVTDPEVLALQQGLNRLGFTINTAGPGSPGNETSFFGPKTKAAVIRFQEQYYDEILAPNAMSAGSGLVGSYTRATFNALAGDGE